MNCVWHGIAFVYLQYDTIKLLSISLHNVNAGKGSKENFMELTSEKLGHMKLGPLISVTVIIATPEMTSLATYGHLQIEFELCAKGVVQIRL